MHICVSCISHRVCIHESVYASGRQRIRTCPSFVCLRALHIRFWTFFRLLLLLLVLFGFFFACRLAQFHWFIVWIAPHTKQNNVRRKKWKGHFLDHFWFRYENWCECTCICILCIANRKFIMQSKQIKEHFAWWNSIGFLHKAKLAVCIHVETVRDWIKKLKRVTDEAWNQTTKSLRYGQSIVFLCSVPVDVHRNELRWCAASTAAATITDALKMPHSLSRYAHTHESIP